MLNLPWLDKFLKGTTSLGLEIVFRSDGEMDIFYCISKKEGDEINLVEKGNLETLSDLAKFADDNLPVSIVFNGKGIINGIVDHKLNEANLLSQLLPDANAEKFTVQQTHLGNNQLLLSVMDKKVMEEVIGVIKKNQLLVVAVDVGYGLLHNYRTAIVGSALVESLHQNNLIAISTEMDVKFGDESMKENFLPTAISSVNYFRSTASKSSTHPIIDQGKEDYQYKRLFKYAGLTALFFLFAVAIVNVLLFNHYFNKEEALKSQLYKNGNDLRTLDKLEKELADRQYFIEQLGSLKNSKTSFYADEIAGDVPKSIQLTDLFVHPIEKQIEKGHQKIVFNKSSITVAGITEKSIVLNNWVKKLQQYNWVKNVTIVDYTQSDKTATAAFQLKLTINA